MSTYKISKFLVNNFRNLAADNFDFCPGVNCIFGDNGNGKTNLLEAIFFLGNKKSFRKNASFPQILSIDTEHYEIKYSCLLEDEVLQKKFQYSANFQSHSSQWFQNGRQVKFALKIPIVFINPFDSYNFHNTSQVRRQWFDHHIGLISPSFKTKLSRFNRLLKMRNTLLVKKGADFLEQIKAIDFEMAKISKIIIDFKVQFIDEINDYFAKTFKLIFSESHKMEIELDSKLAALDEEKIYHQLQNHLEKDLNYKYTQFGVHRDDYMLLMDGFSSFDFSSLGQQKMSYLSLVFAYIELFRYKFRSYPIVLIDDISGELDRDRWQRLVDYLNSKQFQVLITTANESFKEKLETLKNARKIYISCGKIVSIN